MALSPVLPSDVERRACGDAELKLRDTADCVTTDGEEALRANGIGRPLRWRSGPPRVSAAMASSMEASSPRLMDRPVPDRASRFAYTGPDLLTVFFARDSLGAGTGLCDDFLSTVLDKLWIPLLKFSEFRARFIFLWVVSGVDFLEVTVPSP